MPSVVTYWQLPEDEIEFIKYINNSNDVYAVMDRYVDSIEMLEFNTIDEYIRLYDPSSIVLGHYDDMIRQIRPENFDGKIKYAIPSSDANVIVYQRAYYREGKLAQANLAAYFDYLDTSTRTIRPKSPEFVSWAKKILGWTRRRASERIVYRNYPHRATKLAKAAYERGEIDVIPI